MDATTPRQAQPAGRLPENILYFARTLRGAGMRVGPAAVLEAIDKAVPAGRGLLIVEQAEAMLFLADPTQSVEAGDGLREWARRRGVAVLLTCVPSSRIKHAPLRAARSSGPRTCAFRSTMRQACRRCCHSAPRRTPSRASRMG